MLKYIEAGDGPFESHAVDVGVETTQGERIDARLLFGREGFVVDVLSYRKRIIMSLKDLNHASDEARDWVVSLLAQSREGL